MKYTLKHIPPYSLRNFRPSLFFRRGSSSGFGSVLSDDEGFTLIELLVTLAILAVFYGLIITNFAAWRGPQYVKVSGNELATTINRLHSNALSARSVADNPAKYFILQLTSGTSATSYVIQAVSTGATQDIFTSPLETLKIQGGAYIQSLRLTDKGAAVTTPGCVQIVFALPFGRSYIDGGCTFGSGTGQTISKTQSQLDAFANAKLDVVIGRAGTTTIRTVSIDGITGKVDVQ